jgi:lysophospholipase L1-like esterase
MNRGARGLLAWALVWSAAFFGAAAVAKEAEAGRWVGTWVAAQQLVEPGNQPPPPGLAGHTLRQIVQPALSGSRLRVSISNTFGDGPLVVAAASVGRSLGESRIEAASRHRLTFGGREVVTIPAGAAFVSDAIDWPVTAFENLAVSVFCPTVPTALTGHPGSRTTSFIVPGEQVMADELPQAARVERWYLVSTVEVWADRAAQALVVIGDSITDGRGSTTDQNNRWPNLLARRLQANPATRHVAVLNQGIGGGRVLQAGLGPSALARLDRDVLALPHVRWLIVFKGVNDLGTAVGARARKEPVTPAEDLILAYQQIIRRARSHGIQVVGATIMPFAGFTMYDTPESEADRQAVNQWIRTSGQFDAVIDFDAITRDPEQPTQLSAAVDGGDHLHPSAEGYRIMAEAIDLRRFER